MTKTTIDFLKFTKEDIQSILETGRLARMPEGTFIEGFDDTDDGDYFPVSELDADFYSGKECELYTYNTQCLGGIAYYIKFI